jgi:UDP-glucose 4-epimerase
MMRVLVTGAAGFLGAAIARDLHQTGFDVIASSRREPSSELVGIKHQILDLSQPITEQLGSLQVDAIVHAAALLPGAGSDSYLFTENQRMTLELAQWAIKQGVQQLVYLSGCSVYGYASYACDEQAQVAPKNLYVLSKWHCEEILEMLADTSGLQVASLRVSAPYGPGYRNETVVSRFLKQASEGQQLTLMGSGQRSQDFIFETDVALGVRLALQRKATGAFNLTAGTSVNMHELAKGCLECFGFSEDFIVFSGQVDPQDSYRGVFPYHKAQAAFDYAPQIDLQEGLRATSMRFR